MQAASILFQTARASFGQVTVRLGSSTLTCAESELNALQNWPQPNISHSSAFSGRIEKGFLSTGRGAVIQSLPKNSVKYHQTASHISITETSHLLIASPPQDAAHGYSLFTRPAHHQHLIFFEDFDFWIIFAAWYLCWSLYLYFQRCCFCTYLCVMCFNISIFEYLYFGRTLRLLCCTF